MMTYEERVHGFLAGLVREELRRSRKKLGRLREKFGNEARDERAVARIRFMDGVLSELAGGCNGADR